MLALTALMAPSYVLTMSTHNKLPPPTSDEAKVLTIRVLSEEYDAVRAQAARIGAKEGAPVTLNETLRRLIRAHCMRKRKR